MRFGDAYVERNDGTLDLFRGGAKQAHSYASGEWTDVEGDGAVSGLINAAGHGPPAV